MFDNADGRFIKYDDWTAINEMTAADASFGVVPKFVIKLMMMMFCNRQAYFVELMCVIRKIFEVLECM